MNLYQKYLFPRLLDWIMKKVGTKQERAELVGDAQGVVVEIGFGSGLNPKSESLKDLRKIPGVGKSIAQNLYEIDIRSVDDLKEKNPEKLYDHSNKLVGAIQDRCLLYVFRCAIYFAKTKKPKPELLKWWNWK